MKLPAFFGHKKSINLLPRDDFERSKLGIVLSWSLVFGKWAVILTQLVVMAAFLYRFTLDRELTDLRKAIARDVAIIKSYDSVERDYILTQKRASQAKLAFSSQDLILNTMNEIEKITPSDVWYDKIVISNTTLSLDSFSRSLSGFGQFLVAIQNNSFFKGVSIGKLENSTKKGAQLKFDASISLAQVKGTTK